MANVLKRALAAGRGSAKRKRAQPKDMQSCISAVSELMKDVHGIRKTEASGNPAWALPGPSASTSAAPTDIQKKDLEDVTKSGKYMTPDEIKTAIDEEFAKAKVYINEEYTADSIEKKYREIIKIVIKFAVIGLVCPKTHHVHNLIQLFDDYMVWGHLFTESDYDARTAIESKSVPDRLKSPMARGLAACRLVIIDILFNTTTTDEIKTQRIFKVMRYMTAYICCYDTLKCSDILAEEKAEQDPKPDNGQGLDMMTKWALTTYVQTSRTIGAQEGFRCNDDQYFDIQFLAEDVGSKRYYMNLTPLVSKGMAMIHAREWSELAASSEGE